MPAPIKAAHAYTFKHAGSGHKQRRGSVQPSSSKATKKTKKDINRDYLKRKKVSSQPNITPLQYSIVVIFFIFLSLVHNSFSFLFLSNLQNKAKKLKAKRKKLEKSNSHLEGQAYQLRKDQKEAREENIKLMIGQKSQSDSMLELEKVGFSLHTL